MNRRQKREADEVSKFIDSLGGARALSPYRGYGAGARHYIVFKEHDSHRVYYVAASEWDTKTHARVFASHGDAAIVAEAEGGRVEDVHQGRPETYS